MKNESSYRKITKSPFLARLIAEVAARGGKITAGEHAMIKTYLSKFKEMVPMQDLAYAPYGERLLLGTSWDGYIDLEDKAQLEYLHKYLGI